VHEAEAVVALALSLVAVLRRPGRLPEALVAVPAAALLVAAGAVSWSTAWQEVQRVGPVVGFLAGVLALAAAADDEGVFRWLGGRLAQRFGGTSRQLLYAVGGLAALSTALLSLDTTVVLVTPVVVALTRGARVDARAPVYLTGRLANSASLLLPVSNLTNLLAVTVLHVSYPRFAALMVLPWLVAVVVDVAVVRRTFATDLAAPQVAVPSAPPGPPPRFALVVVALTVVGFTAGTTVGVAPGWVAAAGATLLWGHRATMTRPPWRRIAISPAPSFCLFVLALAVIVRALSDHGLGRVVSDVMPGGDGLAALLAIAGLAAVLANLVNNLPAALLLLPVAAVGGVAPVLAVIIGVNVGPNLTYAGSLATLLWRRVVSDVPGVPEVHTFTRLGLLSVAPTLVLATVAVWLSVRVLGTGH
jgi:arsenical pump membrane protein